jgi:hypothetical protein
VGVENLTSTTAQRVLAPPPNPARPWIGVIVIGSDKDLPPGRWQQLAAATDFAAEYHDDTNTIYLRSDIPQIPAMHGLLLVHEMRHWWQARHPGTSNSPESRLAKEVDPTKQSSESSRAHPPEVPGIAHAERNRIRNLSQSQASADSARCE